MQEPQLTEQAIRILEERYLQPDESPQDMFYRVALAIAQAESDGSDTTKLVQEFYDVMASGKFLPNSPTLMNGGISNDLQYSACYVLPIEDSIVGVFDTIKTAAIVHKSGGGTGFPFSRIRPHGSRVNSTGGVASGPVSFMRVFDSSTEAIKQGGRRRGANMGVLRVDHPDIEEFITCKKNGGLTNFNISVALTTKFMMALDGGTDYDLIAQPGWPTPDGGRYEGGEVVGQKSARTIFALIRDTAWRTGDPGLIFIDRVNDGPANPTPELGDIEACNPCVTGDTWIFTEDGLRQISDLFDTGDSFNILVDSRLNDDQYQRSSPIIYSGKKTVYRLQTKEGHVLKLTADHKVMTAKGWVKAKDLSGGDKIHAVSLMRKKPLSATFESLSEVGIEDVYDLAEPVTRSFIANGLVVHNCGEQFLEPDGACNLGSLNLVKFVEEHCTGIDFEALYSATRTAIHFLDNVITVNPYPLPAIDKTVKSNRRVGLGVMGWSDMLFMLGIPYDSDKAVKLARKVMFTIKAAAIEETEDLAKRLGPFPNFDNSIYKSDTPRRNAALTSIAPTGSISIIAGTSSGIEPAFALAYRHVSRQPDGDRVLTFVNPVFERVAKAREFWSQELMDKVLETGSVQGLDEVPEDMQQVFVTAHEISPEWHIKTQAAFQEHTDNGVSKTINLRSDATRQDVENAYLLAYTEGCLGITVFRDGCKGDQVLNAGVSDQKIADSGPVAHDDIDTPVLTLKARSAKLVGVTYRKKTPVGTAYVTINSDEDGLPFEAFITVGKAGSDVMADAEGLGRLISLSLRSGIDVKDIVAQLRGIGSGRSLGFGPHRVMSLADAVALALVEHVGLSTDEVLLGLPEREPGLPDEGDNDNLGIGLLPQGDLCPDCGQATMIFAEGCRKCYGCGYSEC